jgi:hypothetical protein
MLLRIFGRERGRDRHGANFERRKGNLALIGVNDEGLEASRNSWIKFIHSPFDAWQCILVPEND